MTGVGGTYSNGVIFRIKPDGSGFTKLYDFDATNGRSPQGSLISDGTFLDGTTLFGGANNLGVIFKIRHDGLEFTKLVDFSGLENGSNPYGSLIFEGAKLYGLAGKGGVDDRGVIFSLKTDGSDFTKLFEFEYTGGTCFGPGCDLQSLKATSGHFPRGSLAVDGSYLYGQTTKGGKYNYGVIFRLRPDGSEYTKLYDFKSTASCFEFCLDFSATNGKIPHGSLLVDAGYIYGIASAGGSSNGGVVYKLAVGTNDYSPIVDFHGNANGRDPWGSLVLDGEDLYGMTTNGGTLNKGTIFKLKTNGTEFSKLFEFNSGSSQSPMGSLVVHENRLYGITRGDVSVNVYADFFSKDFGTIFRLDQQGSGFATLHKFSIGDGAWPRGSLVSVANQLFGVAYNGGAYGYGDIFRIDPDGAGFTKLFDFEGQGNRNLPQNGRNPVGELLPDETYLYGMTEAGGINGLGTIFRIRYDGTGFEKLHDFTGAPDGHRPQGSLTWDGNYLFGMTEFGGESDYGIVFRVKPDGTEYQKLLDFNGVNGRAGVGSLIFDGNYLCGMTKLGGTNNQGVVFKLRTNGGGYFKLHDFSQAPSQPKGSLIFDGNFLYGMTEHGVFALEHCLLPNL